MRDLCGVPLDFQIVVRDHDFLLVTAELDVVERHFCDEAYLHVSEVFESSLDIRVRRFHRTAHAAKYVDLPYRIQSSLIEIL